MRKISLYKFITTFCMIPVNDWMAFVQRVTQKIFMIWLVSRILSMLKTPIFIVGMIAVLTWAPESVMWIFLKIGEIELRIFAMVLAKVMPDIFGTGATEYSSWAEIWQAGLNILPTEMLEVINGLGVGYILGLVTATWASVSMIKVYRKVMTRAGLF